MNQEELVNQLLPLLEEKLNATTVKTMVASKGTNDYRLQMSEENKLLMSAAITDLILKQAIEKIPYPQMRFQSYMFPLK
jgi:hypothetical protein